MTAFDQLTNTTLETIHFLFRISLNKIHQRYWHEHNIHRQKRDSSWNQLGKKIYSKYLIYYIMYQKP